MYRPANLDGTWPEGPFPLVVHQHGGGQSHDQYEELGNRLAQEGYVFLSITTQGVPPTSVQATELHACAMSWIGSTDPEGGADELSPGGLPRLRCDTVIMGGSQGARGGLEFIRNRQEEQWAPYWFDFKPVAFVGFAPSHSGLETAPELVVPTLLLGAGFDDDVGGARHRL